MSARRVAALAIAAGLVVAAAVAFIRSGVVLDNAVGIGGALVTLALARRAFTSRFRSRLQPRQTIRSSS